MTYAILIPGALICLLGNLYYLLPRGSGDRIQYLSSVLLTEIMFLVMISTTIPMSKVIPESGILFLGYTILLSILTIMVLFVDRFHLMNKYSKRQDKKIKKMKRLLQSYTTLNASS